MNRSKVSAVPDGEMPQAVHSVTVAAAVEAPPAVVRTVPAGKRPAVPTGAAGRAERLALAAALHVRPAGVSDEGAAPRVRPAEVVDDGAGLHVRPAGVAPGAAAEVLRGALAVEGPAWRLAQASVCWLLAPMPRRLSPPSRQG